MAESDAELKYKQEFIGRIRSARASTGMKQWQVALAMDVPQDHYKHWEQVGPKGRLLPHHLIPRFCYATHVDPAWLLTGHGRMKGSPQPALATAQEPDAPRAQPKRTRARRTA